MDGCSFVTEADAKRSGFLLSDGDILIGLTGYVGEVGKVRKPDALVLNQRVGKFFPNAGCDQDFLYFLVSNQEFRQRVEVASHGSAQANVSPSAIEALHVSVPPLPIQCAIAATLAALDDKIELNRLINQTLEAMAKAIFKDWFVDFGPTRAKAEGREPYLPRELWHLFPDALDDEDRPVGWKQGTFADVADSPRRGVSPSDVAEDTPYIGLEHMPRRSIALSQWEGAGKVTSNKSVFKKGEFLFGKLRPYFHKVGFAPLDGICSTDIVVVIPRAPKWAAFVLACLSSDEFVDYTDQTSTGTKMPRTNWKTMEQYEIFLPSDQIASAFQCVAQPLFDRVSANIHETRTLAQTRDLLLPKLMSGEIRLIDAEKQAESVA